MHWTEEFFDDYYLKSIDKITGTEQTNKEVKEFPAKLRLFMNRKDKILKILNDISYNEGMLKEKLLDIKRRAASLDLTSGKDIKSEIKKLEK